MKIKRSEISTSFGDGTWEARIDLPHPYQTAKEDTAVFGHGDTKSAAVRKALRDLRTEFSNVEVEA